MKKITFPRPLISLAHRVRHWFGDRSLRQRIGLCGLAFVLAIGAGVVAISVTRGPRSQPSSNTLPAAVGPQKGTPTYSTILPAGKSVDALGGWTRVSPPDRNPVYAYIDTLGSTQISVSEQPLPKEFESDPEGQTSQLATNYNATRKLSVGSTTVYLGTSVNGPQSVIFQEDGLLVLIKAGSAVDDALWKQYINTLQ